MIYIIKVACMDYTIFPMLMWKHTIMQPNQANRPLSRFEARIHVGGNSDKRV